MPGKLQMFHWDSFVFLSYINGDPDRIDTLDAVVNDVSKSRGDAKIITSILTKVEVAFSPTEQSAGALSLSIEQKINNLLDSCDLGQSNRIKPVLSPASWQIGRRRYGPPSRRWTIGHGRTPTAAAATRALVADRHPQWSG